MRSLTPWHLRTRVLETGHGTLLMAVVNLTPDSFSGDGTLRRSRQSSRGEMPHVAGVAAAFRALRAGADILDLGAESTRPGASSLSPKEEQARLLPVLEAVAAARPQALVSVDTYHASTALLAAERGAEIVNDVSGLTWDPGMTRAVAATGCGLVLMHTRGTPGEWRTQPRLERGTVAAQVRDGLRAQLDVALAAGIDGRKIVIDPGFGFGKLGTENFELLASLPQLAELGRPLLAGLSRKGFLGEAVAHLHAPETPLADARRLATVAGSVAAVLAGAAIVRVHDVAEAREALAVADAVLAASVSLAHLP